MSTLQQKFNDLERLVRNRIPEKQIIRLELSTLGVKYYTEKTTSTIAQYLRDHTVTWDQLDAPPDYYTLALSKARSLGQQGHPIGFSVRSDRVDLIFLDHNYVFTLDALIQN